MSPRAAAPKAPPVAYLGIRHHGPGSARAVVQALDALDPAVVLIEGPSDASELLAHLAKPGLEPPVALLTYDAKRPELASFYPMAVFSPELQAARWAAERGREVRFFDLPAATTLAERAAEADARAAKRLALPQESDDGGEATREDGAEAEGALAASPDEGPPPEEVLRRDPLALLASLAGYADGESWWNDVIEANPEPGPLFDAVATAMGELRGYAEARGALAEAERDRVREAFMRLAIAKAKKTAEGPLAVVCGAWHVPALRAKHAQKADRALLKGRPKTKVAFTWVPWTYPRLASATGYGAGVTAPLWYDHLWHHGAGAEANAAWLARVATVLREAGRVVSTASLIEATRLARSLAGLRARPAPGFEELRDAVAACLGFGDARLWREHEARLLLGDKVGRIPRDLPLAPLLDDLARRQKKAKLKPEALERELAVDLRSAAGLEKSTLLHQLGALDVPWGRLVDPGGSRGTFRERWVVAWEPEHGVRLVEHLVYGQTILQAATNKLIADVRATTNLAEVARSVERALVAQLPDAAELGTERLQVLAAQTSDVAELLGGLPTLAGLLRYGTARAINTEALRALFEQLVARGSAGLPFAVRGLDDDEARRLFTLVGGAAQAIVLAELPADGVDGWLHALQSVIATSGSTPLLAGLAARLLYEAGRLEGEALATWLGRALSPATETKVAAGFFEGFFTGIGARLVHDEALRDLVEGWMLGLGAGTFEESLPLFRRVFSDLERGERRALMDRIRRGLAPRGGRRRRPELLPAWEAHLADLATILGGGPP